MLLKVIARAGSSILAVFWLAPPVLGEVPSPVPTPAATSQCAPPRQLTARDAFAHTVDDVPTLRFTRYVEGLSPKDQAAVKLRVAAAPLGRAVAELLTAATTDCSGSEITYRTTRLIYSVGARWEAVDDESALEFAERYVMSVLVLRDRISPAALDAALAVFGTSAATIGATSPQTTAEPSATPSTPCNVDASATHRVQAEYPGETGSREPRDASS